MSRIREKGVKGWQPSYKFGTDLGHTGAEVNLERGKLMSLMCCFSLGQPSTLTFKEGSETLSYSGVTIQFLQIKLQQNLFFFEASWNLSVFVSLCYKDHLLVRNPQHFFSKSGTLRVVMLTATHWYWQHLPFSWWCGAHKAISHEITKSCEVRTLLSLLHVVCV